MCPYQSEDARKLWSKACNFHRGANRNHVCGNPGACEQRFREAAVAESKWIKFVERWV